MWEYQFNFLIISFKTPELASWLLIDTQMNLDFSENLAVLKMLKNVT